MRSKEDAKDYRYFPEPDLLPLVIDENWIAKIKEAQPEFRTEKMKRYKEQFGLPDYDIGIITESKYLADFFEDCEKQCQLPKKVSNWLMGETMRLLKEKEMEQLSAVTELNNAAISNIAPRLRMITLYAIGASEGYVYVRAEYPIAVERLRIALEQAKEQED